MQSYQHFTLSERESLAQMRKEGKSFRAIGAVLGKDGSACCREFNRNQNIDKGYSPWGATVKYILRRKKCVRKLRRTHLRRRGKRKNRRNTQVIRPERTIHDRPEIAALRQRLGDLEGDTVYGAVGKGCAVTVVDRRSRMLYAALSASRDSSLIAQAFAEALDGQPAETLTLDRGTEFAEFKRIEQNLGAPIYFCDPHSPWQRPSNENINDLLRFFFPKGTDFNAVDRDYFHYVLCLINNRPRKCLGWLSPVEFLKKCCT